jgi:hypothetical protein
VQQRETCINCGHLLIRRDGVLVCEHCNTERESFAQPFFEPADTDGYVVIECPGATLYDPETREVTAGVRFRDDEDPSRGYDIIKHPVFAPSHRKRRKIKKEALGRIRRCRACQDYTIRMIRPEGRDFFIPSSKHPGRKKLKPITHRTFS